MLFCNKVYDVSEGRCYNSRNSVLYRNVGNQYIDLRRSPAAGFPRWLYIRLEHPDRNLPGFYRRCKAAFRLDLRLRKGCQPKRI